MNTSSKHFGFSLCEKFTLNYARDEKAQLKAKQIIALRKRKYMHHLSNDHVFLLINDKYIYIPHKATVMNTSLWSIIILEKYPYKSNA